jgi:hypothetical protein
MNRANHFDAEFLAGRVIRFRQDGNSGLADLTEELAPPSRSAMEDFGKWAVAVNIGILAGKRFERLEGRL